MIIRESYYELPYNRSKAIQLTQLQWLDGWSVEDIVEYWQVLGYDIFFIGWLKLQMPGLFTQCAI